MKRRLIPLLIALVAAVACAEAASSAGGWAQDTTSEDFVTARVFDVGSVADAAESDAKTGGSVADIDDGAADTAAADSTADSESPPRDDAPTVQAGESAIHRILWVGNSFTFFNDLEALWRSLRELQGLDDSVVSVRVASPGYRWVQHLSEATDGAGAAPIREWIVTAPPQWDLVVLQEQSQLPGFPVGNLDHDTSLAAAVSLAALAEATGATPVLFETWGYRAGDPQNAELFVDYPTMQDRLDDGFDEIAAAISAAGKAPVRLRAGAAFRVVFDAAVAGSQDPLAPDSLFSRLYTDDGRHPSLLGSYLTACVLAATLSASGAVGVNWTPPGVTEADGALLRSAAETAVSLSTKPL